MSDENRNALIPDGVYELYKQKNKHPRDSKL